MEEVQDADQLMAYSNKSNYLAKLNFSSSRIVKHMNVANNNFIRTWWAADVKPSQ